LNAEALNVEPHREDKPTFQAHSIVNSLLRVNDEGIQNRQSWSTGVLEYWSNGFTIDVFFIIPIHQCSITPALQCPRRFD
jgi:hypothetical protein